jgi:uroporphyrin-3 C-methyltransferase
MYNSNIPREASPHITVNKTPIGPKKSIFRMRSRAFLLLLIFLFAIGALLFAGIQLWRILDSIKIQQMTQQTALEKLQGQVRQLMDQMRSQNKNFDTLSSQVNFSKNDWVYSSAFYLIQQAIFQLSLNNNVPAQLLLENAEKVLHNTSSPELQGIKVQLSQVIETLNRTKKVDQTTLIGHIDQLKSQVNILPLAFAPSAPKTSTSNASTGWNQIKQLIVIRRHNQPTEPLMEASQTVFLRQNVTLLLERANLAILYRDASLYQSTLQKVKQWVERFFDVRDKHTQNFLQTLDALINVNIMPAPPQTLENLTSLLTKLEFLGKTDLKVENKESVQ